jgi:hypothetical protein
MTACCRNRKLRICIALLRPPQLPSQYIPREERILPAEVFHRDAASVQHVPTDALSTQALLAVPISAGTTLTELSYRDVAAV